MGIETAVAIALIIGQVATMQGAGVAGWAQVGGAVAQALLGNAGQQATWREVSQSLGHLHGKVDDLHDKIDNMPVRQYEERMAAGRRHLIDVLAAWRTAGDMPSLIHQARTAFVDAAAVADQMGDADRHARAEVAIAGCWFAVPSLPDVATAASRARAVLETEILRGATGLSESYRDVLHLCRACGEQPPHAAPPLLPQMGVPLVPEVRLAVDALFGQWVRCAGVDLLPVNFTQGAELIRGVAVEIRNARAEPVSAELVRSVVIVRIGARGKAVGTVGLPPNGSGSFYLTQSGSADPNPGSVSLLVRSVLVSPIAIGFRLRVARS